MNIVQFLNDTFDESLAKNASDVHFSAVDNGINVFFRINGLLSFYSNVSNEYRDNLISRIKILINADISKRTIPQEGRFSYSNNKNSEVDFRVVIMPTIMGETVVVRILNRENMLKRLTELSMPSICVDSFLQSISKGVGLNLICGATGSGKTTTLYASLLKLSNTKHNIVTVEDPVEYVFNDITQIQIDIKNEVLFPNALKHVLRMDPDVILIGEIRDAETAEIACSAALTGHLVIATMHASDALSAIMRMLDMGIDRYLIANALCSVVHQELLAIKCVNCSGRGCNSCLNTGVTGRVAAFEMLNNSEGLKEKLIKGIFDSKSLEEALSDSFYYKKMDSLKSLVDKNIISSADYDYYLRRRAG